MSAAAEKCQFHPQKKVKFLCEECNILVCGDCITLPVHRGHAFVKSPNLPSQQVEKLNVQFEFNSDKSKMLAKKIKSHDEVTKSIIKLFETYHKQLIVEEHWLVKPVLENRQEFVTILEKYTAQPKTQYTIFKAVEESMMSSNGSGEFKPSLEMNNEVTVTTEKYNLVNLTASMTDMTIATANPDGTPASGESPQKETEERYNPTTGKWVSISDPHDITFPDVPFDIVAFIKSETKSMDVNRRVASKINFLFLYFSLLKKPFYPDPSERQFILYLKEGRSSLESSVIDVLNTHDINYLDTKSLCNLLSSVCSTQSLEFFFNSWPELSTLSSNGGAPTSNKLTSR
ncbi:hypothetical protein PPL_09339 [Heterostelium album PN500]|uniref:B box-type domain-containing protein n=1 Tax=Heterostelium pallidum (strain ATCC 26659 / Pp 5 / PN500) TaxID=670386 RepID=D3BLA7_HETP5|nr:hypothetical protein PPL_09339 [Heterostelium album PN500]EFA77841.1 hypothetical protein PPL_09339 [Heterostelium album PN500]|eukprot:XP_020429969.1 hypothetical protein PPL_09339 [Heterostelium album PN500]